MALESTSDNVNIRLYGHFSKGALFMGNTVTPIQANFQILQCHYRGSNLLTCLFMMSGPLELGNTLEMSTHRSQRLAKKQFEMADQQRHFHCVLIKRVPEIRTLQKFL